MKTTLGLPSPVVTAPSLLKKPLVQTDLDRSDLPLAWFLSHGRNIFLVSQPQPCSTQSLGYLPQSLCPLRPPERQAQNISVLLSCCWPTKPLSTPGVGSPWLAWNQLSVQPRAAPGSISVALMS